MRSDGSAIAGGPIVHVREDGRSRPDVGAGFCEFLRREPGFSARQQSPGRVGVAAQVVVANDEPIALLLPAFLGVEGGAQAWAAKHLISARILDHLRARIS